MSVLFINNSLIEDIENKFYAYYTNPEKLVGSYKETAGNTEIIFSNWDALSRTDVIKVEGRDELLIATDGGAAAPIIKFNGDLKSVEHLKYDVNYIPFAFGKNDKSLVIGSGGGNDVLYSLLGGNKKIDAVEINPSTIEAVNKFKEFNGDIYNYPGARNSNGPKLMEEMKDQATDYGVGFMSAEVTEVNFKEDVKILKTERGDIKSRAVVIATGASPRKVGFKGEGEFTGRGVAYCSTCDGQFFEGLEVLVIGAGFAAAEEAMFLTKYATKVTVIAREPEFTCAKSIADKVLAHPKVEVKFNTELLEVTGEELVNHAKLINNVTKEESEYNVKSGDAGFGVFVFVGYEPQSKLFKGILELDRLGYIITNENMETNVPGVYVAGDLRPKQLRQIVTAVSDGAIAATTAERYVIEIKERLGIKEEEPIKEINNY